MTWRLVFSGSLLLFAIFLAAASFALQDDLIRFAINPRMPYEAYQPPRQPDYRDNAAWLLRENTRDKTAEIFYVHGTTYRRAEHWNSPYDDEAAFREAIRLSVPNEIGPLAALGNIHAPKFRQATKYAFFTQKHQGRAARLTAYRDVKHAFEQFLTEIPFDSPVILIGYDQGGLHIQGLLTDYFQTNEGLRKRLAVAYIIDHPVPLDLFNGPMKETPPCLSPEDVRCVASWSDYTENFSKEISFMRKKPLVWEGAESTSSIVDKALLCTNPVSWSHITPKTGREDHLGASSATGLSMGERPAVIEKAVSVSCENGIALTSRPSQNWLRRAKYFGNQWKPKGYNLFYRDLQVNAESRLVALAALREDEALRVDPIKEEVEIEPSPINKVPR